MPRPSIHHALAPLLALAVAAGCASLPRVEELTAEVAAGDFVVVDGRRIHLERMGSGPPLLLVHGFGGSTYSWRLVQPLLARHFDTAALDLYGFGLTARPRERLAYARPGQVRLLRGTLAALGWTSAHVAGHSYGGGLAMTLAHRHPEAVRSLVLIASTAPDYAEQRRHPGGFAPLAWLWVRTLGLRPATVGRSLERSFADDRLATPELVADYLRRLKVRGAARAFSALTAPASEPGPEWRVRYSELAPPTLAIWGAQDTLIPPAGARRAVAEIPDSRFELIPDCGHIPMEEAPRALAERMIAFLAGPGAR